MSTRQDYIVAADGWVAGAWRAGGSTVSLTGAQAKYEYVSLKTAGKAAEPSDPRPGTRPGTRPDPAPGTAAAPTTTPADKAQTDKAKADKAQAGT